MTLKSSDYDVNAHYTATATVQGSWRGCMLMLGHTPLLTISRKCLQEVTIKLMTISAKLWT